MSEHTPTPWCAVKYESGWALIGPTSDDKIARVEKTNGHANAAFIVRAVNAHEELLAALKETLSELRWTSKNGQFPGMDGTIKIAKQAIAKAEGNNMDYFTCKRCGDDVRGPIPVSRLCDQCRTEAK